MTTRLRVGLLILGALAGATACNRSLAPTPLQVGPAGSVSRSNGLAPLRRFLVATPTPSPTQSAYPFQPGETSTWAYSSTDSFRPSPTSAPSVTTYSETETSKQGTKITFDGHAAYDVKFMATAPPSSAGTSTHVTDNYRNFVPAGQGEDFLEYGFVKTSKGAASNGTVTNKSAADTYGTPFIIDEVPEVGGAHWLQPIARTETIDDTQTSGGKTTTLRKTTQKRSSDGSYTYSGSVEGTSFTQVENPDGTGTYDQTSPTTKKITFGKPVKHGTGYVIPVTIAAGGSTSTVDVPDWFPGHGPAPKPLSTFTRTDSGAKSVPAGCGPHSGKKSTWIHQVYAAVDAVGGFTYNEIEDDYVIVGLGTVCLIDQYTDLHYDHTGSGKPTSSETFKSIQSRTSETPSFLRSGPAALVFGVRGSQPAPDKPISAG